MLLVAKLNLLFLKILQQKPALCCKKVLASNYPWTIKMLSAAQNAQKNCSTTANNFATIWISLGTWICFPTPCKSRLDFFKCKDKTLIFWPRIPWEGFRGQIKFYARWRMKILIYYTRITSFRRIYWDICAEWHWLWRLLIRMRILRTRSRYCA